MIETILAGAQAASSIINPIMQHVQNKKNRQFSKEMYAQERADNRADWAAQNAYNSPAEQMKRFEAAGLNKNLIYGQGNEAQPIKQASYNTPDQQAPQFSPPDIVGTLSEYQNYQNSQLETSKIEQLIQNAEAQRGLINAQTMKTIQDTQTSEQNLKVKRQLETYYLDSAQESLRAQQIGNVTKLDANQRAWADEPRKNARLANDTATTMERIITMQAERSKIPLQKALLEEQAKNVHESTLLTAMKQESERIGQSTARIDQYTKQILQESALLDNIKTQSQITSEQLDQEAKRIRNQAKALGLSETYTQDIIESVLDIFKPFKQMGSPIGTREAPYRPTQVKPKNRR